MILKTRLSSGIGRATALKFAEYNATVIVTSKNEERGKKIESELKKVNFSSSWIKKNILVPTEITGLFNVISEKYQRLDIAFNNASTEGEAGKLEGINEED